MCTSIVLVGVLTSVLQETQGLTMSALVTQLLVVIPLDMPRLLRFAP